MATKTKSTREELIRAWADGKADRDAKIGTPRGPDTEPTGSWAQLEAGDITPEERAELEAAAKAEWSEVKALINAEVAALDEEE